MNRDVHAACLVLYPDSVWKETSLKLRRLNRFIKQNAEFIRRFTAGASPVVLDPTGRMLLPYALMKDARMGKDIKLMVDAHGTWNEREAKRFCRGVEDCNIAWFEEPVSPNSVQAMAEVRATTDIPISAGESLFTRFDFQELIEARAADILQPDPGIAGGITEVVRIAALASAHQLTLAPHLWGSALLFSAGLQIAAATPNVVTLEYSMGFNPFLRGLSPDEFTINDSNVYIPDKPGLGVTINEDFVREYSFTRSQ